MYVAEVPFPLEQPDTTPAFIYHLGEVKKRVELLSNIKDKSNCKVFYSVKPLPLLRILEEMEDLEGFSVSSLFEAKLVQEVSNNRKEIHFISPGIRSDQWEEISTAANYLTFNSLEQFSYFEPKLRKQSYGIRVNPEVSFIADPRYNPCREFSKLGTPISEIKHKISSDTNFFKKIEGIHFHSNCESKDFSDLSKTLFKIKSELSDQLKRFKWINLGGGYFFDESENISLFYELIDELYASYKFSEVIIEPGNFLVRDCGYLISSVIDLFRRDGKNIAILDSSVNHLPEVFEYQYEPDVCGDHCTNKYEYILAGSSCLAGDVFGVYRFEGKLAIGSRVIFEKVGSYSLVKAHTFNGINLPDVYCLEDDIELKRVKSFTLEHYMNYYGG
ncbi:MAG: carboxynorspermidine decarboxylase [Bacteroidetes bacterium]|nr:carboxynorspermidine decarboxylase [Bacteroidota bacterium]